MGKPKVEITRERLFGGMDSTTPAHLLSDEKWVLSLNMESSYGRVSQVVRKLVYGQLPEKSRDEQVLAIVNMPEKRGLGTLLALTNRHIVQIKADVAQATYLTKGSNGEIVTFNQSNLYERWAFTQYNNQVWFTNLHNPLMYTNGSRVGQYATQLPSARYITVFFDHIFVAHVSFKGKLSPTTVMWSHLYDPSQWEPSPTNEADQFDIEEVRSDHGLSGITGMSKINDELLVFTPSCIIGGTYTGRKNGQKVMYFQPKMTDIGNYFRFGLVSYGNLHFFFDGISQDFYMYTGAELKPIGAPILTYFKANLTTNFELQQRTWAYTAPEKSEVGWVFCDRTSSYAFRKAVVYNWKSNAWYVRTAEQIHSVGGALSRAKTIDELAGTIDSLGYVAIEDLSTQAEAPIPRIYGGEAGNFLQEDDGVVSPAGLLSIDTPVLETKDFHYNDMVTIKEVESLILHASYTIVSGIGEQFAGVLVEVSVRDNIGDPVVYTNAGTWTPNLPEKRLSLPRTAGRIVRYRFSLVGSGTTSTDLILVSGWSNWQFGQEFQGQDLEAGNVSQGSGDEGGL